MQRASIGAIAAFIALLLLMTILPITASEGSSRQQPEQQTIIFFDDFSNDRGWNIQSHWEIGVLGPSKGGYNGADPVMDISPNNDNKCLGSRVPGTFRGQYYQFRWATSPVIDCSKYENVAFTYWSHDHTDYILWQNWYFDVKDIHGNWHSLWYGYQYPGASDSIWRLVGPYDLSHYADKNPNLQVRFGYYCRPGAYTTAGINIDDIEVKGVRAGIPAEIKIEPQTLNLGSNGNYMTVKIEGFPENPEYTPSDVDITTISIAGLDADLKYCTYNQNKIIGKLDRLGIEDAIGSPSNEVEIMIEGRLYDGTRFQGTTTIKAN